MEQNFFYKGVSRSLNLSMKILSPFKMENQKKKLSKRFVISNLIRRSVYYRFLAIGIGNFSLVVFAAIFTFDRFEHLRFSAVVYNVSISRKFILVV